MFVYDFAFFFSFFSFFLAADFANKDEYIMQYPIRINQTLNKSS